jgi:hypothetical protein
MTTNDQLVARASKQAAAEVKDLPDSPEARARTVAAMQAAMSVGALAPVKSAPPSRLVGRLALAAGLSLLAGASLWLHAQPRSVGRVVASSGTLPEGHRLAEAEVVDTGQAQMTLQLSRDVKVRLQAETAIQLRDDGTRVVVRRGEVAAEVVSLDTPFFLDSGDTQLSTRSARFTVKPGAGCDGRAEVKVTEGSVVLDGSTTVQAGEEWPRCEVRAPPPEPVVAPPVVAPPVVEPERARLVTVPVVSKHLNLPPPPLVVKDDDRLARQNELYLQALTLQRSGEVGAAVKKLEAVLADPKSPLAETALAQKMRWLSATDRSAARDVARDYLQRYPMGFGRADAETLVLEKP